METQNPGWKVSILTCYRYLLEGNFYETSPFIRREDAYFNICFSCVAYLNTSYALQPVFSPDEERATIVVSGFHGLQLYANRFWADHLLSYCAILSRQRKQPSRELLIQLDQLLRFLKDPASDEQLSDYPPLEGLNILDQHPRVRILVSKLEKFRAEAEKDPSSNTSEKSAAGGLQTAISDVQAELSTNYPRYLSRILLFRSYTF